MKKFPILEKLREFRCSLSRPKSSPRPRPITRLNATARRAGMMDDYDDDQPTTKLSSAFIVVLILHIVAVGGIFAFKGIKAHRQSREVPVASATERPAPARPAPAEHAVQPEATPVALAQKVIKAHGGETLAKVAAQQGVSVNELAQYNGLNAAAVLRPNQSVVIPPAKSAKAAAAAATTVKPASTAAATVKTAAAATPTNSSVEAKRAQFLTSKNEQREDSAFLAKASATTNTTAKPSGGVVKPFNSTGAGANSNAGTKTYTVAKSDTLTSIAKKHGVTTDALMKLNKIEDPKKLQPNTQLQIPPKKSAE